MWKSAPQPPGLHRLGLPSEPWACVSPESLQTPVLSRIPSPDSEDLILKCKAKVPPEKPALQLFYSLYKDSRVIQNRSHSPIFSIAEAKDEDSGLYQCMVATKDGTLQKRSNLLKIQLQSKWMRDDIPKESLERRDPEFPAARLTLPSHVPSSSACIPSCAHSGT